MLEIPLNMTGKESKPSALGVAAVDALPVEVREPQNPKTPKPRAMNKY